MQLHEGEHIQKIFHKHPIIMWSKALGSVLCVLLPLGLVIGLDVSGVISWSPDFYIFLITLLLSWSMFIWLVFFVGYTNYFLDVWILTDRRLIDIEQIGLFSREISILRIEKIQDATIETHGLIAHFFDFGDVRLQTAGAQKEFIVTHVRNAAGVKNDILQAIDRRADRSQNVQIIDTPPLSDPV